MIGGVGEALILRPRRAFLKPASSSAAALASVAEVGGKLLKRFSAAILAEDLESLFVAIDMSFNLFLTSRF